jgi:hypothetical protein
MCPGLVALRVSWIWLALALVALPAPAVAEPGFVWQAPASCPDVDEVQLRVERRLGKDVDGMLHGIEIEIERDGAGYVATVDLRGVTVANDIRTLRSSRCDELADAIAVIIARVASEARQTQVADVDDDVPPGMRRTRLTRPAPEPVVRKVTPEWGGGLRALALSGVGAQPGVGIGGELAGYVRHDDTFAEIAYARWSPSSELLHLGAPGRVDVSLGLVALRMGWGPERMPIRAWFGAELGRMKGAGVALNDPDVGSGRWTALDAGFGVAWPMARHARLVGTFEIAAPLERTRFALIDGVEVYRAGLAAARCSFGIEVGWR